MADGGHVDAVRAAVRALNTGACPGIEPSGRMISVELCEVFEFGVDEGGRVADTGSYVDPLALFHRLGVVPAAGTGE